MIRILHATLASVHVRLQHCWVEQRRCLRLRGRIGLAAVNGSAKALIAASPEAQPGLTD